MTELDSARARAALDALLDRAQLPLTPEDYERLVRLYASFQAQCAALRSIDLHGREPVTIYSARIADARSGAARGAGLAGSG